MRPHDVGLKQLVELDASSPSHEPLREDRRYAFCNKLWRYEPAGCVVCADLSESTGHHTLRSLDDDDRVVCLLHGALEQVAFHIRRSFEIRIGADLEYRGGQDVEDTILIPRSLDGAERRTLFARLIKVAGDVEHEQDDLLRGDSDA